MSSSPYEMTISRMTVDKLGIKMYDKVSAVVAELIANSYDADANLVTVTVPIDTWLAIKKDKHIIDQGYTITVEDDGIGMEPEVINDFYLKVGSDPRKDSRRGPKSRLLNRPRMGRKGIGKLAPFGISKIIEVISSGGEATPKGYKTAHFMMYLDEILFDEDTPYYPHQGLLDGKFLPKRGTTIKLSNFDRRLVPDKTSFDRQLSRRFGIETSDFKIKILNTKASSTDPQKEWLLGELELDINHDTFIDLSKIGTREIGYEDVPQLKMEDGTLLPITGWIAYSNKPYKNEEMAGIRIYARGKIVSTTRDFGISAGFTGEYKLRSYLIGAIKANWLDSDEEDDLIRSDRQDILWDAEKGIAFRNWGHEVLRILAKKVKEPMRKIASKEFLIKSNLEEEVKEKFSDPRVVKAAVDLGKSLGAGSSLDELEDEEYVAWLKKLVFTIAPHKMLVDKMIELSEPDVKHPLELVVQLFNDAKVAELASLGQIAEERIKIIKKLEDMLKYGATTSERQLQKLLEEAPWLIDPEWTVLQSNETFESMREAFERWYQKKYGKEIITSTVKYPKKRPDFIMMHIEKNIEIVEIKDISHTLEDKEFENVLMYLETMEQFMAENKSFKKYFPYIHITLVCDNIDLKKRANSLSYAKLEEDDKQLIKKTWEELLNDTKQVHQAFLKLPL